MDILADKNQGRRIGGPIHVLSGHGKEVTCCYVSSDLGIVVSCLHSSDVLLHSMKRGRLIRRLKGEEAHSVCLLPAGVVMTWNQSLHAVSIFTLNGIPVGSAQLPSSCSISCMEMSADGENALTVVNKSVESAGLSDGYRDFSSRKFKSQEDDHQKVDKADRRFRYFPAFNLFPLFTFALYLNEKNKFH